MRDLKADGSDFAGKQVEVRANIHLQVAPQQEVTDYWPLWGSALQVALELRQAVTWPQRPPIRELEALHWVCRGSVPWLLLFGRWCWSSSLILF